MILFEKYNEIISSRKKGDLDMSMLLFRIQKGWVTKWAGERRAEEWEGSELSKELQKNITSKVKPSEGCVFAVFDSRSPFSYYSIGHGFLI